MTYEISEECQRLERRCRECNLSLREASRECHVEIFKEYVTRSLRRHASYPHESHTLEKLIFFGGVMLEEVVFNVEGWKHRAHRRVWEAKEAEAWVVLHLNEEDAPPLPTFEDMSEEEYYTPTCPNIDSWLESNLREKHEASFNDIENLVARLGDLCKEGEEIQLSVLHGLQFETLKVPQVEEIAKLSLWPNLCELIFQSIMMAVLRNWKARKICAQSLLLCNVRTSWVKCSPSLKLISKLEKRELEQRWWKKKKWRDKFFATMEVTGSGRRP